MQQQQDTTPTLQQQYNILKVNIPNLPELPIHHKKLLQFIEKNSDASNNQENSLISKQCQQLNSRAIDLKFIKMMQKIFIQMQPELRNYRKHLSIQYLDHVIVQNLDREIYHKGYKLHKKKQTPMANLLQTTYSRQHQLDQKLDKLDITNKLFTEIFDIMHELLKTMKIYYGYQQKQGEEEGISLVLYQAITTFIQQHQESIIVQQDRLSLRLLEQEEDKINSNEKSKQQIQKYQLIIDVLKAMGTKQELKNTKILDKAGKFVGVFYKYGISPVVNSVYEMVKSVNPLANVSSNLSKEQQDKLKVQLIMHLVPHLSVRSPVEENIVTYLIKLIPMTPEYIIRTMGSKQKQKFVQLLGELMNTFEKPNNIFKEIVKQLMELLKMTFNVEQQDLNGDEFYDDFKEGKWIILLYKAVQKNYDPQRRRFLLTICRYPEIIAKLQNPVGILKLIQSQSLPQTPLIKHFHALPVITKSSISHTNNSRPEPPQQSTLALQHQLHRIHLYVLKKCYGSPPLLRFEKLTHCTPKKTITFLFSGFMSQDTSKYDQWQGLLESIYDSQMYSVRWESKSYGDLFDYIMQASKDIAKANLSIGILGTIGGPYLRAVAILREIYKKYNSNPFNPAFQAAKITGDFIAEMIIQNFQGHFINLVGFSLGGQLIKNILVRLNKKKKLNMINKVYLMGGVADRKEFESLLEGASYPLNILNMHSNNDSVLKYFLKLCKPSIEPIGLHPIREDYPDHIIQNQDCSDLIHGHMDYRSNLRVLDKLMNIKDD